MTGVPSQPEPGQPHQEPPERSARSGLRNPAGAVRGVGAGALTAQGIALLLAIQPMRVLGGELAGAAMLALAVLAAACFLLAAQLRRRWAWLAGSVVPVGVIGLGLLTGAALVVLGVIFGLVWIYVLHVRATVRG